MPIKPENRAYYQTAEWKSANAAVRARAGNFCEWCKKPAGDNAQTLRPRYLWTDQYVGSVVICDEKGDLADLTRKEQDAFERDAVWVKCALTVAHWPDPNPENLGMENLRLLCQRCHNTADAPMRAVNAKATREAKRATHQPLLPLAPAGREGEEHE